MYMRWPYGPYVLVHDFFICSKLVRESSKIRLPLPRLAVFLMILMISP